MSPTPVDLLAIGPHPDDVEIFAGGTLLAHAQLGARIAIIDLTRGELGSRGSAQTRAAEADEASRRLGLVWRHNLRIEDGDLRDTQANRHALASIIRRARPQILLGPAREDYHPDHVAAANLVSAAYFLAGLKRLTLDAEPYRPPRYFSYFGNLSTEPRFIIDVSETWEQKLHVVRAYSSQITSEDASDDGSHFLQSADILGRMQTRGRHFGLLAGTNFGEPFTTQRPPALAHLP